MFKLQTDYKSFFKTNNDFLKRYLSVIIDCLKIDKIKFKLHKKHFELYLFIYLFITFLMLGIVIGKRNKDFFFFFSFFLQIAFTLWR